VQRFSAAAKESGSVRRAVLTIRVGPLTYCGRACLCERRAATIAAADLRDAAPIL
jgi:hypothetical protein